MKAKESKDTFSLLIFTFQTFEFKRGCRLSEQNHFLLSVRRFDGLINEVSNCKVMINLQLQTLQLNERLLDFQDNLDTACLTLSITVSLKLQLTQGLGLPAARFRISHHTLDRPELAATFTAARSTRDTLSSMDVSLQVLCRVRANGFKRPRFVAP